MEWHPPGAAADMLEAAAGLPATKQVSRSLSACTATSWQLSYILAAEVV